ncbi:MAG: molybdenum cofactor biosynthesis protein MoaE [Desulfobacterales bacterium]|nr:MAG: molybdenum cofactor biosynthesis protein MoaE [Desulfobacterales bacterium]
MKSAAELAAEVRSRPDIAEAGMVLCHTGLVRSASRDGRPVSGLRVAADRVRLAEILEEGRRMDGILDVRIEIDADRDLAVGDAIMHLVVAGDYRENVIAALSSVLDAVKSGVTAKTEFFTDGALAPSGAQANPS